MIASPARIGLLPEHLIDQIKAGEVIERPGNLLKEILENSIDAGSTKIELTLKNNGLDLISLKDNGHGIVPGDLPLAFSRHATSKITNFEDLYRLHSYGFRGEALASIAAIARVQCITFTEADSEGAEIRIEGGLTTFNGKRTKAGHSHGTELVIQDLFFNTPARLKFIQSQQAEKTFVRKIIFSFVLAHPGVEFILKFDDEEKEVYLACASIKKRLLDLMPKAKEALLHQERSYEYNNLDLYLIPANIKGHIKFQNVYINGRYILDKQIPRVLSNAMMSAFGNDDFNYLVFLNLPPDHIDVNVHPNKTVIKLFEVSKLIALITGSVREMAQQKKAAPRPAEVVAPQNETMFSSFENAPLLPQTRHEYNLEGHFSPHQLPLEEKRDFTWIGNYLLREINGSWEVVHAQRLLSFFILERLERPSQSVPLLVSEPFKVTKKGSDTLVHLNAKGLELEMLGEETAVLRSIPDWMNGFPLKDIVQSLINGSELADLQIQHNDWPTSVWEEMLNFASPDTLRSRKISMDLKSLLEEKFK